MSTVRAHCNRCQGETTHNLLHTERQDWDDKDEDGAPIVWGWDEYRMLKCAGCQSVRLMHEGYFSEHDGTTTSYYPPAMARSEPKWLNDFNFMFGKDIVRDLLKEIFTAIHNSSIRLATIGTRSLLEHVMIEKVGDKGSFFANLKAFRAAGFVSEKHAEFLEITLNAGHASTHRAWKPSHGDFQTLMDVTETIIEAVYVLEDKVRSLKSSIPPRL